MKFIKLYFFWVFFGVTFLSGYASGSGKYSSHCSTAHTYNLGMHSSGSSNHYGTNHYAVNGHNSEASGHTHISSGYSHPNPKSTHHSSIVGNSVYFRANKNPPKHSAEDDRDRANVKAKTDKDTKALVPTSNVQHAVDPFRPQPKPKPGSYTPAAPIFLHN